MDANAETIAELGPRVRIRKIAPWLLLCIVGGSLAAVSVWEYESARAKQVQQVTEIKRVINDLVDAKLGPLVEASQIASNLKASNDPAIKPQGEALSSNLNQLTNQLIHVRESLTALTVANVEIEITGIAWADDGRDPQRTVAVWIILASIMLMTVGCFGIVVFSQNKLAVGYAIDALKVFGGLYIGVVNAFLE